MKHELEEMFAQTPVTPETVLPGYSLQLLVFADVSLVWKDNALCRRLCYCWLIQMIGSVLYFRHSYFEGCSTFLRTENCTPVMF